MAFKCGHCQGRHDKAEEARNCAERKRQAKGDDSPATPKFLRPEVEAQVATMSENSQEFLRNLLSQFGLMLPGGMTPATIPWHDGKKILSGLIDARRLKAAHKPWSLPDGVLHDPNATSTGSRRPTVKRLPDCAPGYYAVPDWTSHEQLKFFWVKVKKGNGPYAGWTFIDEVIGGHAERHCNGKYAVEAIEHILDFGPDEAGTLYADELKNCYKCNKHLTKKASRILRMGRHCAYENGKGEDWDALNWKFGDADAED